jgi:hypothetical protein
MCQQKKQQPQQESFEEQGKDREMLWKSQVRFKKDGEA